MADRTVNGLNFSENGWRMVDQSSCVRVKVPGTNVTLQIREGQPAAIMGAFAADFNAYVEPLRDADSACWTATNSVASSNHLSGTAMDLNWNGPDGKTFRLGISEERAYPGDKARNLRELLNFYGDMIFCGGNWSIRDWMHFQMGGNTYGSQNVDRVNDFIRRKIRADGFSTYRRSAAPPAPAPSETYGLPRGSNSGGYGQNGVRFPDWVYALGNAFGLLPSTYPGHQETERNESGYAPNPQLLNRGIDWAAPGASDEIDRMTRFADYLATIPQHLEQVIWQNPRTMRSVEVAGGRHQPGYFAANLKDHRNHVHTRQSRPIPIPGAPPPPPTEDGAVVLSKAMGGSVSLDRYRELLPAFRDAVTRSNAATPKRINMFVAQLGHESSGLKYMEEIADGSAYEGRRDLGNTQPGDGKRFKGRGPIQITGRHNYTALSQWAHSKGYVPSPTFFVDQPVQLASPTYGFLGAIWYWTVARPKINEYCDWDNLEDSLVAVTKAINGGTNGLADRRNRLNRARSMDLAPIMRETAPPVPPTQPGDDMALVPQEQWDNMYRAVMNQRASRSPLREPDESTVGDTPDQIWDMDGSIHVLIVYLLASLGHPGQLALLNRVASTTRPERQQDKILAQAILAEVTKSKSNGHVPAQAAPQVVYVQPPVPDSLPAMLEPLEPEPETTGGTIGALYDALEKMRLADALPIESRAPLAALISVLTTKNGSQL